MTSAVAIHNHVYDAGVHDWFACTNDLGDRYEACRACGKQASWIPLWAS